MDNEIKWLDPCGLGLLRKLEHQLSNHGLLEFMRARFRENGNTFKTRVLLDDFYWTCEPQNVKTMLATQFRDFDVGIDRESDLHYIPVDKEKAAEWNINKSNVNNMFYRLS